MRTREESRASVNKFSGGNILQQDLQIKAEILWVLHDIRYLLANPPIEITGKPLKIKPLTD